MELTNKEYGILEKYHTLLNKIPADWEEFYANLEVDENLSAEQIGNFTKFFRSCKLNITTDYYCKGMFANALEGETVYYIPPEVTTIGQECFLGNEDLEKVGFITNSKCRHIHSQAFKNCTNLKMIFLPHSLVGIGKEAFSGCPFLSHVGYEGTIEDWKKLHLATYWYRKSGIQTVVCKDGEIEVPI